MHVHFYSRESIVFHPVGIEVKYINHFIIILTFGTHMENKIMNQEESHLLILNAPVLPSSLNSSTGQGTTRVWYTDFFIAVKVYVSM